MDLYQKKELKKPNFFQRTFGKMPVENSIIEINNLLALNQKDVLNVSTNQIIEIENRNKINLKNKFPEERLELYKIYLR